MSSIAEQTCRHSTCTTVTRHESGLCAGHQMYDDGDRRYVYIFADCGHRTQRLDSSRDALGTVFCGFCLRTTEPAKALESREIVRQCVGELKENGAWLLDNALAPLECKAHGCRPGETHEDECPGRDRSYVLGYCQSRLRQLKPLAGVSDEGVLAIVREVR